MHHGRALLGVEALDQAFRAQPRGRLRTLRSGFGNREQGIDIGGHLGVQNTAGRRQNRANGAVRLSIETGTCDHERVEHSYVFFYGYRSPVPVVAG